MPTGKEGDVAVEVGCYGAAARHHRLDPRRRMHEAVALAQNLGTIAKRVLFRQMSSWCLPVASGNGWQGTLAYGIAKGAPLLL